MKQEALSAFQYGNLSAIAMVLFMVTFIGFFMFAYSKKNKSFFEKMANMPISSDEVKK